MAFSKNLPLSRAEKVPRTAKIPSIKCSNYIAAIDFGTSSVSLAYITPQNDEVQLLKFHKECVRPPNAILIGKAPGSNECEILSVGQKAQEDFTKLDSSEMNNRIYFERMKMRLEKDETVNRDTTVPSFTGGNYYLIEVIALIIKYLKERLLHKLEEQNLKATDFDWVITVPAIWKDRAKTMMREAAYLAGLTFDHDGITRFNSRSQNNPIDDDESQENDAINPHKLTLALEPEAAAIYVYLGPKLTGTLPPERYMVVDMGGGTVDIAVHERKDGIIKVLLDSFGNSSGGTTVNQAFRTMMENLVEDKGHTKFLNDDKTAIADIIDAYYNQFEIEKKDFGEADLTQLETQTKNVKIALRKPFVDFYGQDKISKNAEELGMTFDTRANVLSIKYEIIEKLFQPTIESAMKCVKEALDEIRKREETFNKIHIPLDTIYLVGGFGGCVIVKKKFEEFIRDNIYIYKDRIKYPDNPELAVCKGAVLWRRDPNLIQSRIANATYGIGVCPIFDPSIHDEHYRYTDKEDGKERCRNVFKVFVLKGEVVENKVYKTQIIPKSKSTTISYIQIYSTKEDGVQYIQDKSGKMPVKGMTSIGMLKIKVPNPDNVPNNERDVDIFMDFIGTEIQASAKYSLTGEEVKTVCDFL